MRASLATLVIFATSIAIAGPSRAGIITFDDYAPLDTPQDVVTIGGLDFTRTNAIDLEVRDDNPVSKNGTPALIYSFTHHSGEDGIEITRHGGGDFTLLGFDAGISWYSNLSSDNIFLTYDTHLVYADIVVDRGFQTFDFNYRGDRLYLSSVDDGYLAIDNVRAFVPEPASWAMMILGFGSIGVTLRRRRPRSKEGTDSIR